LTEFAEEVRIRSGEGNFPGLAKAAGKRREENEKDHQGCLENFFAGKAPRAQRREKIDDGLFE